MKSLLVTLVLLLSVPTLACPFCAPTEADLFSELQDAQAVVLVSKVETKKYKILEVLKGQAAPGKIVLAAEPRGKAVAKGGLILTTAAPANLPYWSDAPRYLDANEVAFVRKALPVTRDSQSAKWDFAAKFLEHSSEEVANAAYSILAAAPLSEVQKRAKVPGHAKLISWAKSSKIPEERRALYLLMAYPGLSKSDASWLKTALFHPQLSPMSTLVGPYTVAYLQVTGPAGVPEVQKRFLTSAAPPSKTLSVTRALALVGHRSASAPLKEAVKGAFLKEVAHPARGPYAIAPLAVWKDYRAAANIEKLGARQDTWIKVAVIRYFRTFSSPEAKAALGRLSRSDSGLVSRTTDPYKVSDLGIE